MSITALKIAPKLVLLSALLASTATFASGPPAATPRDNVAAFVQTGKYAQYAPPVPQLRGANPASTSPEEADTDDKKSDDPSKAGDPETPDAPPAPIIELPSQIKKAEDDVKASEIPPTELNETVDAISALFQKPEAKWKPLPFYLTAEEYLSRRGKSKGSNLYLKYQITPKSEATGLALEQQNVSVIIGPDFAAETRNNTTRIYDFRTQRAITVNSSQNPPVFTNTSLYALAFSHMESVKRATNNGKLNKIQIAPDKTLDAFWLEADMGWTARKAPASVKVTSTEDLIEASYDGSVVASILRSGPALPSEAHFYSLAAWWHHSLAIHPTFFVEMNRVSNAPKSLNFLTKSPAYPTGLQMHWALQDFRVAPGQFPLPKQALNEALSEQASAVQNVIADAANIRAVGGRPSSHDLKDDIYVKTTAGDYFGAWLTAQRLAERIGGCQFDRALLCEDIRALESGAVSDPRLNAILKIKSDVETGTNRPGTFDALTAVIGDPATPSLLMRWAGQTRARVKDDAILNPDHKTITAEALLQTALAKDPYDPNTYAALSQTYAAQGRWSESWDILDALRNLPDAPDALRKGVDRVENSLISITPGYFSPESAKNP